MIITVMVSAGCHTCSLAFPPSLVTFLFTESYVFPASPARRMALGRSLSGEDRGPVLAKTTAAAVTSEILEHDPQTSKAVSTI